MEHKSIEVVKGNKEKAVVPLTEYQKSCMDLMLDATNSSVTDRHMAETLIWDFDPSFEEADLDLTLKTISTLYPKNPINANNAFSYAIDRLLTQNEDNLEKAYEEGNQETKDRINKIFSQTFEYANPEYLGPALRFYLRRYPERGKINDNELVHQAVLFVNGMRYYKAEDKEDISKKYFDWAREIFEDSDSPIQRQDALRAIIRASETEQLPFKYLEEVIEAYGLDSIKTLRVWEKTYDTHTNAQDEFITQNIRAISRLEEDYPGICKALHEQYGIVDFARYPHEVLKVQYMNRDREIPYGVLIFPESDYNGAFAQLNAQIYTLWDNLAKLGYSLRIYESASRGEVIRALSSANRRYGDKNKISFAVLGGHGTVKNMQFGESEYDHSGLTRFDFVGKRDVENRRAQMLKDIFTKNPSISLVACSTGAEAGLGESISKLGAFVSAPEVDAILTSIKPYEDDNGHVRFRVVYKESDTSVHFQGEKLSLEK